VPQLAKAKMAVLANVTKEIGLVEGVKVTGHRKAPGLRIEGWR